MTFNIDLLTNRERRIVVCREMSLGGAADLLAEMVGYESSETREWLEDLAPRTSRIMGMEVIPERKAFLNNLRIDMKRIS